MLLLILVAGFYMLMSGATQNSGTKKTDPAKKSTGIERGNVEGILDSDKVLGRQMPSTGGNHEGDGWDMEDADTKRNSDPDGDWSMDTDAEKKDDSTGLRLNNSKEDTKESDWEIDDVDK